MIQEAGGARHGCPQQEGHGIIMAEQYIYSCIHTQKHTFLVNSILGRGEEVSLITIATVGFLFTLVFTLLLRLFLQGLWVTRAGNPPSRVRC